jgi:Fe-S-cluster containining protein
MPSRFPARRDQQLVQIVDAALADATRRAGDWLACRPGCTQCCIGVFAINQLDAARLTQGFRKLKSLAPDRAAAVHQRARDAMSRLSASFPGDPVTGILADGEESRPRFEDFANDEPCPALNPQTGLCELYDSRPMTCRVFGPPVRSEDGLGVCELCFHGATHEQIQSCEMIVDPENLEEHLLAELEKRTEVHGSTIIAFCLGLLN